MYMLLSLFRNSFSIGIKAAEMPHVITQSCPHTKTLLDQTQKEEWKNNFNLGVLVHIKST